MSSQEILTIEDIKLMVDTFYAQVREDDLLKDIFNQKIQDNWEAHLEKMYRFWQTILLCQHTYNGSPFAPHAHLPVERVHFERWLLLFNQTIDSLFVGDKVLEAKWRAEKMAIMFWSKIDYYRHHPTIPIL
jgi:hemoglobin